MHTTVIFADTNTYILCHLYTRTSIHAHFRLNIFVVNCVRCEFLKIPIYHRNIVVTQNRILFRSSPYFYIALALGSYNFFGGFLFGRFLFGRFLFGGFLFEEFLIVLLTDVYTAVPRLRVYLDCSSSDLSNNAKNRLISFLEPGTAPRKVQVRPLSSSTMVIQWDEPETPNGQVTVGVFSEIISHHGFPDVFATFANECAICPFIGI